MKHIYKALANFQQEVPVIHKGTTGYGYSYADLPTIFEKINPLLKKHGLGFTQLLNGEAIDTIIFHVESGENLVSSVSIPQGVELKGMNQFQVLGSAITYLRRYALSAALGLITDVDNDAAGEQTKEADKSEKVWLNENTEAFTKAKEFIAKGGTIQDIRKKYNVSKKVAELLTK
jgi:ERF superfamily